MRIFKNKAFSKWAVKEKVSDQALKDAVEEIGKGLVEANLGGNLYKKRVAVGGKKAEVFAPCWPTGWMIRPFLFMASLKMPNQT